MRSILRRLPAVVLAVFALSLTSRPALAQRALVYCPVGVDETGCANIVSALSSRYVAVDRGYDGSGGTVDLRTADLRGYSVVVIPSLADADSVRPYALLRDADVVSHLRSALIGGLVMYSGTPDQGSANRSDKNILLLNLVNWADSGAVAAGGPGLVALLDASPWIGAQALQAQ